MMHTGNHHEQRARQERAKAIRQAWHWLSGLARPPLPRPAHMAPVTGAHVSAGCVSRG